MGLGDAGVGEWGWTERRSFGLVVILYFLMLATAFLAASSRSLADVIGSPLSDKILLASCTLVPGSHTHKHQT